MKFKSLCLAAFAVALSCALSCPSAFGQATLLPPGEQCFSALSPTSGGPNNTGTGFIGLLGTITGGTGGISGTYGGVSLTGGSGSNATANITVSGGIVTQVAILNPGLAYVAGDVLSAASASIGGVTGFSVPVSSVSINYSLAGGSVGYYIPNTLTFKQTWQDSGETILNQNPVPLDANGCAVVYGAGIYRQILKDSLGNTVWDKLTAATGPSGIFWAGQAGGTGNAITVTDSAFAFQDGATIQFLAFANNTGPTTVSVSGGGAVAIVKDTSTGPAALSGGEIGANNTPLITYDATNAEFHLVNPAATSSSSGTGSNLAPPQGYLNLVGAASGSVIQGASDVIGVSTVYYSPFVGNTIPIWNGSVFKSVTFSELTATLTGAGSPLSTIQDECVFSNNGVPTLVTGPQWTTATAGSGSRGTGAGTPQLIRLQGIWVNAVSIIGYNGLSSFTIPANQCTYVGSLSIDATAGQVSAYRTWGSSRKWGVWNAYNRQTITLQMGDSAASWVYASGTIRQSHGSASNTLAIFMGLPEEVPNITFSELLEGTLINGASLGMQIGIGYNSITSISGTAAEMLLTNASANNGALFMTPTAYYTPPPSLGINNVNSLEAVPNAGGTATFIGGQTNMVMQATWRG
jgi:hypothetical protein